MPPRSKIDDLLAEIDQLADLIPKMSPFNAALAQSMVQSKAISDLRVLQKTKQRKKPIAR